LCFMKPDDDPWGSKYVYVNITKNKFVLTCFTH
jgi:hypothetical protein